MRPTLLNALTIWLQAGGQEIGQACILPQGEGWLLCHTADSALAGGGSLTRYTTPEAAREIGRYDAGGAFRPLRTAPSLNTGWELLVSTLPDLLLALDFLYPAAVANWVHHSCGHVEVATLRETLNRQTGIYRVTALIRDDEARQITTDVCAAMCLRRILWPLDAGQPLDHLPPHKQPEESPQPSSGKCIPLLCSDACPLLVGAARSAVKARMKRQAPADAPASQEGH